MKLWLGFQHEKRPGIVAAFVFNDVHLAIPRLEDQALVKRPDSLYYEIVRWQVVVERNFLAYQSNPGIRIELEGISDRGDLQPLATYTPDSKLLMLPRPGDEINIEPDVVYSGGGVCTRIIWAFQPESSMSNMGLLDELPEQVEVRVFFQREDLKERYDREAKKTRRKQQR